MKFIGDPIYLVVADHDTNWMLEITQELNTHHQIKVVGFAQNGATLLSRIKNMDVDAILTDVSLPDMMITEIVEQVPIPVFGVSRSITESLVRSAKAKGVVEIYPKDEITGSELADHISSYVDSIRQQAHPDSPLNVEPEKKKPQKKATKQYVILTYNTKGGVGKSTIAANLAMAIQMSPYMTDRKVCLVDFDAGGANVVTNVHLTDADAANRNIAMWEYLPEDISANELENYMLEGPRGLKIVAAPVNQAASERIDIDLADKILRILKRHYGIIVIDGAPNISSLIDSALIHSTHILMITNAEGQSVRQLSRIMKLLAPDPDNSNKPDLSYITRKMFLVLNYAQNPTKWDLKPNEVSELVGKPVYAEIPYDEVVRRALHGTSKKLAVELDPDSPFSTAIKVLANNICNAYPGTVVEPEKKSGLLGGIFGRKKP